MCHCNSCELISTDCWQQCTEVVSVPFMVHQTVLQDQTPRPNDHPCLHPHGVWRPYISGIAPVQDTNRQQREDSAQGIFSLRTVKHGIQISDHSILRIMEIPHIELAVSLPDRASRTDSKKCYASHWPLLTIPTWFFTGREYPEANEKLQAH